MNIRRTMLAAALLAFATGSTAWAAAPTPPVAPAAAATAMAPAAKTAFKPAAAGVTADPACMVKGNVNAKGDKIYHDSTDRAYARTIINKAQGDQCFATVDAAKAAGFRAPKHG